MNAHHQKRSYRHSLPPAIEYLTLGADLLSAPSQDRQTAEAGPSNSKGKRARVWTGIERVPFGWQVSLALLGIGGGSPSWG